MPFYKFILKTGHRGSKKNGEMEVGAFAPTYTQALEFVRKAPMVKHSDRFVVIKSEVVNELDYIVLMIKNRYAKLNDNEIDVNPLINICKCKKIFNRSDFNTDEARCIVTFCNKYEKADNGQRKNIEEEYRSWALGVIENYIKQKEDSWGF